MTTLESILKNKRHEVDERKGLYPVKLLEQSIFYQTPVVSMKEYLLREGSTGIIAEIKRISPSRGVLNASISIERTSIGYMQAGAAALSILTDKKFFGGSSGDLMEARKFNFCPILRKDFIIDEYQIIESKSIGSDAILLIASVLEPAKLKALATLAHSIGLEVLVETRNIQEIRSNEYCGGDMIGINNRDLGTMEVSMEASMKLVDSIPASMAKISESGIDSPDAIISLRRAGFVGFLLGTVFMQRARPEDAALDFIRDLKRKMMVELAIG